MPGIIAIIDFRSALDKENENLLTTMTRAITHEKWHAVDIYCSPPIYASRVHLGIENSEPQPIWNEDRTISIIMDGRIFDYEKEKETLVSTGHKFGVNNDVEFCLHSYEELGEEFVRKLNGSFTLVIYDERKERIIVANDRHGLLPLYYCRIGDKLLLFSEVKAILKASFFRKDIDHEAIADFFAFGRLLGNKTFFKKVKMMPPSSILTLSKKEMVRKEYWNFRFEEKDDSELTEDYYVNRLAVLLKRAVARRTRGEPRYGVFLSGGLDSRAVVAAIDKNCYPISTFTFGTRGGDEIKVAERVARALGTKHTSIELKEDYLASFAEKGVYLTDGMLNCAHFHWISFLDTVKKNADVMFHGLGMEFLLSTVLSRSSFHYFSGEGSGLLHERRLAEAKEKDFPELLFRFFNGPVTEEMMPIFYSKAYYEKIRRCPRLSFERYLGTIKEKDPVNKVDSFWLHFFGSYYLSRVILRNFCEDRVPSLDNDFLDFALTVPRRYRFRSQALYFKLLGRLAPSIAKIPYERTGVAPIMPNITHKIGFFARGSYKFLAGKLRAKSHGLLALPEKIGYPDYDEYIRKNEKLRAFFEKILLDEKTLSRGYFNPSFVTQMVKDHMKGKKNWAVHLCALLTFEMWNRLFMDQSEKETTDYSV